MQDQKNSLVSDSRFRDALGGEGLIPRELSHFALLRPALVVKYEHIKDALKEDQPQWGGVFICDDNEEIEKLLQNQNLQHMMTGNLILQMKFLKNRKHLLEVP